MKVQSHNLRLSAIAVAVSGVLLSMAAQADEAEIKALIQPTNSVELGVVTPSKSSAKFGEYNGLNTSATRFIGGINVRGGTAYTNNEQGGLERWSLQATDLGCHQDLQSLGHLSKAFGATNWVLILCATTWMAVIKLLIWGASVAIYSLCLLALVWLPLRVLAPMY